jgi:hypothetical protein
MISSLYISLPIACTLALFHAGAALAEGCDQLAFTSDQLVNEQVIEVNGGDCGGRLRITARLQGKAQFFNEGSNPSKKARAELKITDGADSGHCWARDPEPPTGTGPNTIDLACNHEVDIARAESIRRIIRYYTNNVSDNPLPTLTVRASYIPQPR